MQFKRFTYIVTFVFLIATPPAVAREKVTLQLRWLHQFQFAGYYMAKEKGYYEAADLDVRLIAGGPHALKPMDQVLSGSVEFAVTGSGVVIERLKGKPIVALAAIMQTSPIVWITLKSANIREPRDLLGRNVLVMPPPESAELLTILHQEGISTDDLKLTPSTYRIEDLIDGKTAAYDGYVSNEPYYLTQNGIDYHLISPRDYGINFYSDVLVTRENFANSKPETVVAFTNASLKGWQYALDNLEETIQVIKQKYAPNKSVEHLRYEARSIRNLVMPDLIQVGHMNPGRWQFIAKSYQDLNMTNANGDLEGFIFEPPAPLDYQLALQIAAASLILLAAASLVIFRFNQLSKALRDSNRQLAVLATLDPLTGVKNRRGFFDQAKTALSQANRVNSKPTLLMLDIDHFKQINDCFGHPAGDEALRQFSAVLHEQCREHDVIGRVGGEEFAIILLDSDKKQAMLAAERIVDQIHKLQVNVPECKKSFSLTTSIGAAEIEDSLESAWKAADSALYQAKCSGRDRIEIAH